MLAEDFINKDNQVIFINESKAYKGKDLVGVTQEEMMEMKKKTNMKSITERILNLLKS